MVVGALGLWEFLTRTNFCVPQRGIELSTVRRSTALGEHWSMPWGSTPSADQMRWACSAVLAGLAGTAGLAAWAARAGRRTTLRAAKPKQEVVEYEEGGLALAKFEDDGKYYTVKTVKDKGDKTWDIVWIEEEAEDNISIELLKPQKKEFQPGDLVVAKCADDGGRYTGEVKKTDGAYVDVEWLEEGGEETVFLDCVWTQKKKFKIDQVIEAVFPDDGEWYEAKVKEDLGKCKFKIEWDEVEEGQEKVMEMFIDNMRVPRVGIETLEIGQKLTGTVGSIREFGAFVDCGCYTDGLVHVSKMAMGRVTDPTEYVQEDQEVTVWVSSIDTEQNRLGLSLVESKAKGKGKGKGKGR